MNQKPKDIRNILLNIINRQKLDLTEFVTNPKIDFSRNRKIPYDMLIFSLLTMEGTSLTNHLRPIILLLIKVTDCWQLMDQIL